MAQEAERKEVADIFTVRDVYVEKTTENASDSRQAAIAESEILAFQKLIELIVSDKDIPKIKDTPPDEISRLIKSFEVDEEKISGNTYKAAFHVSFNQNEVKKFLQKKEIALVEKKNSPTLILPIYSYVNGQQELWETSNPWWQAWSGAISENKNSSIILPLGDIEDLSALNIEDIKSSNLDKINELAKKYDAKDTLVVEAKFDDTKFTGKPIIEVSIRLLDKDSDNKKDVSYEGSYEQTKDEFFNSTVKDIIEKLETDWIRKVEVKLDLDKQNNQGKSVALSIPIKNLKDWLGIKSKIESIDYVSKIEVLGLTSNEAKINMFYESADLEEFKYYLTQSGYNLKQKSDEEGVWLLESITSEQESVTQ